MVIGLNHSTASLPMRERFWIGENARYQVLRQLKSAEGIEELVVLCTRCRTEFLIWASDPTLAANSLLRFLGAQHGLKLTEWQHFYRRLDDSAISHIFRVASGLDSLALGEPQMVSYLKSAWEQAQTVGAAGRFLNALIEKALQVSTRVQQETAVGKLAASIPAVALDLASQVFGSLEGRKVLLLGTGRMNELSARALAQRGAGSLVVIDQSSSRAQEMAEKLGGTVAPLSERWSCMLRADIVISATGCPHAVLTREEAERIAQERNRVPLVILDIAIPRDVDPDVHRVDGIVLYDLDGLERAARVNTTERAGIASEAEKIVSEEAQAFRSQLQSQPVLPTSVALRRRLNEICRQELESFIEERGPFTREQDQSLHAVAAQLIQKIANSLARELKELPERAEQERMTAAVTRLFHLDSLKADSAPRALAGTRSEKKERREGGEERAVAINF